MKVSIGVYGRFHAFNLAAQLQEQNALSKLITSYPVSQAVKFGVSSDLVLGFPSYEVLKRLNLRISKAIGRRFDFHSQIKGHFSRRVAGSIDDDVDVVNVWSGVARPAIERAREIGAVFVLERGSAHPEFTANILEGEFWEMGFPEYRSRERSNDMSEYHLADFISVPSSFARRTFLESGYDSEKLITVPYGVDLEEFPNLAKTSSRFRLIHVGAISFQKGVHRLIKVFHDLNLPNAELCLVGSVSPEMTRVMKQYEGVYKYLGVMPQSRLYEIYNECDVFCLNSIQDGFGMVILQAMACGLPLICSENTGGPDVIDEEDCGIIVPARSDDALKDAITRLYYNRKLRKNMGVRAYEKAVAKYTWEQYGQRVLNSFGKVVDAKA